MIKAKYQKMYTEKYKQDMDFVLIGDYYLGPFIDMDVAQKAVSTINKQLVPQENPRTKEFYEEISFNHAWELVKHFELQDNLYYKSSSTPTYEKLCLSNIESMLRNTYPVKLYCKVEKEVDWREEVEDWANASENLILNTYNTITDFKFADLMNRNPTEALEMCRVVLRATGELNDGQ